jgi:hypothetical protein
VFAVDSLAVQVDVENPLLADDQFKFRLLGRELFREFGRQTDGLGFVVSLSAVGDSNLHGLLLDEYRGIISNVPES